MNTEILGLLAETSIHPGSGQDAGFVDLPVAREAATDYPVIVGSSFKGALRDRARGDKSIDNETANRVFGEQENAGDLIVSDVRLVALPVRSLTSTYKWITCSHLVERLSRDMKRADCNGQAVSAAKVEPGQYVGAGTGDLYLEERQFTDAGELPSGLVSLLTKLILHVDTADRLANQLVVLHNDDFAWFARYGLAVNARNALDNEKKTSKNLWYEETIPPDSLFYCLLAERSGDALATVRQLFNEKPYIQVGANATVGQGWFGVQWLGNARGDAA